jgi:hypothetical protein
LATFLEQGMAHLGRELTVDVLAVTDAVHAIVERSIRLALLEGGAADPYALARAILPHVLVAVSREVASAP